MSKTHLALVALICYVSSVTVVGQTLLESYIQEGIAANLVLRQQGLDIAKQQELLRQANALGMPKFSLEANYTLAAGGRKIDFPIGDLLNGVYGNLNALNAVPGNLPPGVMPGLFPTLENQQVQFLPNNFHETRISFVYPIYNAELKYNREIQGQLLLGKTAQKAASEYELRYQITEAYLQYLCSLEAEKIWQGTRTVLIELRRFNESLVRNDVATSDVVATANYEISKADQEISRWKSQQNTAKAYFNYLINRDLQSEVLADTNILRQQPANYTAKDTAKELVAGIEEKRQEFAVLRAGQQAAETDVRRNAANLKLPDFYLGGSFGFQGFGYTFDREQAYVLAQVGLSYDLFDGGLRKSKTQEAHIQVESIRNQTAQARQQIALQVTSAWNEWNAAQNTLVSTEAAIRAAEESFRIVSNKYRAGQALLLEYMDARNRLTTAQLQHLLAQSEVVLKEAALKKAAGI